MMNVAARAAEVGGSVNLRSPAAARRSASPCRAANCLAAGLYRSRGRVERDRVRRASCCFAGHGVRPLWLTLALIAGIAVARYTVAAVALIGRDGA